VDKSILGKRVRDTITGFEGIAVAIAHYLNGCTRVCIQPRKLKDRDGGSVAAEWFDDSQVKVLQRGGLRTLFASSSTISQGGPQCDPVEQKHNA